jgi:acyl carrier protein
MTAIIREKLRGFIQERLKAKGDTAAFTDSDSLFISTRLDSLDAMEMVVVLEEEYGIDFSKIGFDLEAIDSINDMVTLIGAGTAG